MSAASFELSWLLLTTRSRRPEARVSILRIHSRKVRSPSLILPAQVLTLILSQMSLQRGINLRALAEKMGNCSGAEVRGICTEAGALRSICLAGLANLLTHTRSTGMYALRERRQHVTQEDFEMSVAKVRRPVSTTRVVLTLCLLPGPAEDGRLAEHVVGQAVQLIAKVNRKPRGAAVAPLCVDETGTRTSLAPLCLSTCSMPVC